MDLNNMKLAAAVDDAKSLSAEIQSLQAKLQEEKKKTKEEKKKKESVEKKLLDAEKAIQNTTKKLSIAVANTDTVKSRAAALKASVSDLKLHQGEAILKEVQWRDDRQRMLTRNNQCKRLLEAAETTASSLQNDLTVLAEQNAVLEEAAETWHQKLRDFKLQSAAVMDQSKQRMKAKIDALKPTKARTVASVVESLEAHLDDRQVSDPVRCRAVNQLFSKYCQIEEKVLKDQGEVPLPNKQRKWYLKQKLAVGPEGQVSDFYEYLSACTTKELKDFLYQLQWSRS